MNRTYIEYLGELIRNYKYCVPIYSKKLTADFALHYDISRQQAAGAVSVALKRIIERGLIPNLRLHKKGVYYLTQITPFGELSIDKHRLVYDKYISHDNGYVSGLSLLHQMGLTSQMPNNELIVSNVAGSAARKDIELDVVVKPPKTQVTKDNKVYLQTLDALELLNKAPIDVDNPFYIIGKYIDDRGLDYRHLLMFANNMYNKNTVLNIAKVAGEGIVYP
ncbi:MAG: hypothetical protein IJ168_02065 [Eubacterium sp.]|nr:hypothetical protein [Eubacterium sp.]